MYIGENEIQKIYAGTEEVSKIYFGTDVIYSGGTEPTPDYEKMYFTIEMTTDGVVNTSSLGWNWKLNDGEWQAISPAIQNLQVQAGDKIQMKGTNYYNQYQEGEFRITGYFIVYGNLMSLCYGDNFTTAKTFNNTAYAYQYWLAGCTGLTDAENLILPATGLSVSCYSNMFKGCTNLVKAPKILPATTLTQNCYENMFEGCTSLTTAPELPATTLVYASYYAMFFYCLRLNYVKCLATDLSAEECLSYWLDSTSSTGTFVKAAGVTWPTGNSGIPNNWTIIDAS